MRVEVLELPTHGHFVRDEGACVLVTIQRGLVLLFWRYASLFSIFTPVFECAQRPDGVEEPVVHDHARQS